MSTLPIESEWYQSLVRFHGRDRVAVGPSAYSDDEDYWVSGRDEDCATPEEHQRFYEGLAAKLRDFGERSSLPNRGFVRPAVVGDFFGIRSEILTFSPSLLRDHVELLAELIDLIQSYLALAENVRWRVLYTSPSESLAIYPSAIFLGAARFPNVCDASGVLPEWLNRQTAIEKVLERHFLGKPPVNEDKG
jgi:hypothetical protein